MYLLLQLETKNLQTSNQPSEEGLNVNKDALSFNKTQRKNWLRDYKSSKDAEGENLQSRLSLASHTTGNPPTDKKRPARSEPVRDEVSKEGSLHVPNL